MRFLTIRELIIHHFGREIHPPVVVENIDESYFIVSILVVYRQIQGDILTVLNVRHGDIYDVLQLCNHTRSIRMRPTRHAGFKCGSGGGRGAFEREN